MTKTHLRRPALLAVALVALLAATVVGSAEAQGKYGYGGESLRLLGGQTALVTDPATTKVLLDNGISPEPVGPTRFELTERDGMVSARYGFPITGGKLDKRTLAGTVYHSGGINFVKGDKNLLLTNFQIVIDDNPGLTAMVNNDPNVRVRILDLDLGDAVIRQWSPRWWRSFGILRVKNVGASLTEVAADALNASLGVDFFAEGIPLGTAKVFAVTKTSHRGHR